MSVFKEIDKRLDLLHSDDPHVRDLAAAEIADYLQADLVPSVSLGKISRTLLAAALTETDETSRESLFNALSTAAEVSDTSDFDWAPLAERLDDLSVDCLEHALVILGFSGNRRYRAQVEKYLSHPFEGIRAAAADALAMLDAQGSRGLKSTPRQG